uniref:Wsv136-like protein n=1 Tax=Metapenaeus ensis majanivirus TaxID=2984279 RepID=A0A9C7BZM8_9VIRU|nr:MAG: wsv136-like protein [Metapenaeus ensis majanivirus]
MTSSLPLPIGSCIFILCLSIIFLMAINFIHQDVLLYINQHKNKTLQFTSSFPLVDPQKAAIILFKLQKDITTLDVLPPKALHRLRNMLTDPRSFLVKSYGTHLGRIDFINIK